MLVVVTVIMLRNMRFYIPKVLYSEGSIYSEGSMFRNSGFCSLSSKCIISMRLIMDDMAEIERVWVGVGVKIKKSGNVEITARTWRLK